MALSWDIYFCSNNLTNMRTIWVLLTCLPMLLAAQEKVVVNDPLAQVRDPGGSFTEISVSSSVDLYLSNDDREMVVVSAREPQFRDRIITRVNGNRLEIYFNSKGMNQWTDLRLKAYVSFKTLSRIRASGSSDIFVNGVLKADALSIELSGSSDFSGAVDVGVLKLNQSGSSDSKLSGRAGEVWIDLSGASDVKAFDLDAKKCTISLSGSSDASMTVNGDLSVIASGASDVRYRGTGVVRDVRTSGSSSVKRVD